VLNVVPPLFYVLTEYVDNVLLFETAICDGAGFLCKGQCCAEDLVTLRHQELRVHQPLEAMRSLIDYAETLILFNLEGCGFVRAKARARTVPPMLVGFGMEFNREGLT